MKNKFILFFLIGIIHTSLQATRAVLCGNVTNGKFTVAETTYNSGMISYSEKKQSFQIDKKGNFKLVFDLDNMKEVYLIINEQQTEFYIEPVDSITLKINYADFDNSLQYAGKGGEKNNLFKTFSQKFITGHEQDVFYQIAYRKAPDLSTYCDSLLSEEINFITTSNIKPDAIFLTNFKTKLVYESAKNKLEYQTLWAYFRHKNDTLPDVPASYYNFMKKLSLNNDSLLNNQAYFEYVKTAMSYYGNEIKTTDMDLTAEEELTLAGLLIRNDKVRQAYEAAIIYSNIEYGEFSSAEKMYLNYLQKNTSSVYISEIKELYSKVQKIAPGQNAAEISLVDDQGKSRKLSDFKGKVIYLDFWASWCGPCIHEMPSSKKLHEEFAQKDVVFLYVSIDEDPKSWKDAISIMALKV